MATKGQQTGMRGVFLVAAELAAHNLIVSTTSRNAMGADLLVADPDCNNAFSVQVKTNATPAGFWLLGQKAERITSPSHLYVFVNLHPVDNQHEYFIVPSKIVATGMKIDRRKNSTWYSFLKADAEPYRNKWDLLGASPAGDGLPGIANS
jgi:hypothetical protein